MSKTNKLNTQKPEVKRDNTVSHTQKKERVKTKATPVDQVLHLQRTIGNQAVQRLFKSGVLQAKLKIGKPGDKYEQEADRVAEQVMRMSEPKISRQTEEEEEELIQPKPIAEQITPLVQRQAEPEEEEEEEEEPIQAKILSTENPVLQRQEEEEEEEELVQPKPITEQITPLVQRQEEPEEEEEPVQTKGNSSNAAMATPGVESSINSLKGGGQPLSKSVRNYFEPKFGYDFSGVRVHADSKASKTAEAINAKAFTSEKNVVFGSGEYSPETSSGKRLLAHELTHVVQQASGNRSLAIRRQEEGAKKKAAEVDERRKAAWNMFTLELKDDYPDRILSESIGNLRFAFVALIRELMFLVRSEKETEMSTNALESSLITVIPHVGSLLAAVLTALLNRLSARRWETIEQWIDSIEDAEPLGFLPEELVTKGKSQFLGDPRLKTFFEKQYASFRWSKDVSDIYSAMADITGFLSHIKDHPNLIEIYDSHITPRENWKQKLSDSIGATVRENVYLTRVEGERPWLEEEFTLPPKLTPKIIKEKLHHALSVQENKILYGGGGLSRLISGPECKYIEGAVKAVYNHIVAQVSPSVWQLEENLKAGKLNLAPWDLPWEALDNYKAFDAACTHIYFGLKKIPYTNKISQEILDRVVSDHMDAVERYFAIRELIRTWYGRRRKEDVRGYEKCLRDFPVGHPWRERCSKFHLTLPFWGEWRNKAITHGVYR